MVKWYFKVHIQWLMVNNGQPSSIDHSNLVLLWLINGHINLNTWDTMVNDVQQPNGQLYQQLNNDG